MTSAEYRPPDRMPPEPEQVAATVISELKAGSSMAAESVRAAAVQGFPTASARTAASFKARVKQASDGYDVVLDAGTPGRSGTRAHVVRFLQRGTGEHGPRRKRIPDRKRGWIRRTETMPSGRGQKPRDAWRQALKRAWRARRAEAARMGDAWERAIRKLGLS